MVANVTDNTQKFQRSYNIREVCVCTVSTIVYTGYKAMELTNTFFVTEGNISNQRRLHLGVRLTLFKILQISEVEDLLSKT